MSESFIRRFYSKVKKSDACWLWTACRNKHGYGRIGRGAKQVILAHRASWEIAVGPVPEGMSVLHRCDNPPCVNPAHLFLGTHADNMRDRDTKGRRVTGLIRYGESNHRARLTNAQALEIYRRRHAGEIGARLAAEFGISQSEVCSIYKGRVFATATGSARQVDDVEVRR